LLTGASRERPKGLGCKSPRSFKGVGRCQSGIHHRSSSDPFGQVCQTVTPSDATSSRPSNLPAPKLTYFSNLYDALKSQMHSEHKLGHTNPTTDYFSYDQGQLPIIHKNISKAFKMFFPSR